MRRMAAAIVHATSVRPVTKCEINQMRNLLFLSIVPLLAAQSVNLLPFNSSDFGSNWQKFYVALGSATALAPDGVSQAQSLDAIADPNPQVHLIQTALLPIKATDTESASLFLKAGALHQIVLVNLFTENGVSGAVTSRVDLNTGSIIGVSTDCCAFSTAHNRKIDSVQILLQLEQPAGGPYLDATGQTGLIYLWGAQIDKGATPLPYQPVL